MSKTLEDVVREFLVISKEVSKGLASIAIPSAKPEKPKWCQCNKCGSWHYLAK